MKHCNQASQISIPYSSTVSQFPTISLGSCKAYQVLEWKGRKQRREFELTRKAGPLDPPGRGRKVHHHHRYEEGDYGYGVEGAATRDVRCLQIKHIGLNTLPSSPPQCNKCGTDQQKESTTSCLVLCLVVIKGRARGGPLCLIVVHVHTYMSLYIHTNTIQRERELCGRSFCLGSDREVAQQDRRTQDAHAVDAQ